MQSRRTLFEYESLATAGSETGSSAEYISSAGSQGEVGKRSSSIHYEAFSHARYKTRGLRAKATVFASLFFLVSGAY